jgi:hypothetical protein
MGVVFSSIVIFVPPRIQPVESVPIMQIKHDAITLLSHKTGNQMHGNYIGYCPVVLHNQVTKTNDKVAKANINF